MISKAGGTFRLGADALKSDKFRPIATIPAMPLQSPYGRGDYTKKACRSKPFLSKSRHLKSVVVFSIRFFIALSKLSIRKSQRFGTGFILSCRDRLRGVGQQSRHSVEIKKYLPRVIVSFFISHFLFANIVLFRYKISVFTANGMAIIENGFHVSSVLQAINKPALRRAVLASVLAVGGINLAHAENPNTTPVMQTAEYYQTLITKLQEQKNSITCDTLQGLQQVKCKVKISHIDSQIALTEQRKANADIAQSVANKKTLKSDLAHEDQKLAQTQVDTAQRIENKKAIQSQQTQTIEQKDSQIAALAEAVASLEEGRY